MAAPHLVSVLFLFLLATASAAAQNANSAAPKGVLHSSQVNATGENEEFRVVVHARSQNTSWEIDGRESALLRVTVDDRYDQHVFLFRGEVEADYEFMIGPLNAGSHNLRLHWDRSWTPDLINAPEIKRVDVRRIDRSDPSQEPILRAPILHIRKDTMLRFSDVPLLLYWELENRPGGKLLTHTVILSNEDGGTNTERLMARWGRTTDIEWCYSYHFKQGGAEETFQARDHKTLPFSGVHEGWHPILYIATQNNNFADILPDPAPVRVRMVPVAAELIGRSRESVMDRFPWIYSIAAKEMERERKIEFTADPKTVKMSDQRNYAYLDVCAQQSGTELSFELEVRGRPFGFRSDHADPRSRIGRSNCFRSAIELPEGTAPKDLARLFIHSSPAPVPEGEKPVSSPHAMVLTVNQLFFLQPDFGPGPNLLSKRIGRRLKPGQSHAVYLNR